VAPSEQLARFGQFKRDPIDVDRAGARLGDALRLMDEVGWE
jgi:iron(III) transport system substrate-binding protein